MVAETAECDGTRLTQSTELGFIRGENDKSVFYHPETHVRIATHVDDSLVRGPKTAVAELFEKLKAKFIHHEEKYVHEDGGVYFLGMRITETVEDGVTWRHMDQQRDIEELLEQHGFDMARSVAGPNTTVPMPNKYLIDSDDTELTPVEQSEYRSIVGSLQYFVCGTQWHLAHPVARLGQFNAKATKGVQSGVAVAPPVLAVFTYVGWLACAAVVAPAGRCGHLMNPTRGFPAPDRRPARVGARCGRHKKCRFG